MNTPPTKRLHADFIEEVKQRADIVDVISGYVDLKKQGKDYFGLCPFHDEKSPSFSVSATKGLAYCFGCDWGGSAIKFLMELGKVSFADAVKDLARSSGVKIQYEDGSSDDFPEPLLLPVFSRKPVSAKPEEPKKDYTVSEGRVAESVFRLLHHKGDAELALSWLGNRGITREMVKRYQLGLEKRVVTPDESHPEKKETYWAIAIFIPVPNRPGRFYLKKRVAPWLSDDERPSYLGKWAQFGVPATIWFTHNPDDAQETYYVEGEWDAIRLAEEARLSGEKVAIACSTSGAGTVPKPEELERLPGQVTIFYDRDEAGTKGAQKLVGVLGERGRVALVPMQGDCQVKGWDISNALDASYTWEDFKIAASLASTHTPPTDKDESLGDRPISRDRWEATFGFGKRLKQALESFKGFGKPPSPQPNQPKPQEQSDQSFTQGSDRLAIWRDAVAKGYRHILDNSGTGLGKSYSAGVAVPEDFGVDRLWYLSGDHRNPTTDVIESNYVDLPVRHNGLKIDDSRKTPNGNPFLVHPKPGEEADTRPNCYRTPLFRAFAAKGYHHQESAKSAICNSCKVAHLCKQGSGVKYGATFRGERASALSSDRIRAHPDSLSPSDEFDYSKSLMTWDEAGTNLKTMHEIPIVLEDFDHTFAEIESKASDLHEQLKPVKLALRPFVKGDLKQPYHGWDDAAIRARLPEKPDNLSEIIASLELLLEPDLSFLEQKAEFITAADAKRLKMSRGMKALINKEFRREANQGFHEAFSQLPLNWLIPFLKNWNGEPGALRCEGKTLTVFVKSDRHTAIAKAAKSNIYLDATLTKEQLALLLEINPEEIYVVGQETPNYGNLKILQITGMGKLGKDRSESLKRRVAALRKALKERYPGIVFGDWKCHAESGDGQWFVNLRGSNEFQNASAMAVFGVPYQNIGYLQALYQTLTGEYAPLDKENPHEGLQQFIKAHTEADIEQALGRLRSHLRPNEELTFIFVGDYDLSFLGLPIEKVDAFEITPEAGTPAQITRWKILEAIRQLREQGEKVTQSAIASLAEISQPTIAKIAASFGGWKAFNKILLALLDPPCSGSNNSAELSNQEKWLAKTYLPCLLDDPEEDTVGAISQLIKAYGFPSLLRVLLAANPQTQAKLLALVMKSQPVGLRGELLALLL